MNRDRIIFDVETTGTNVASDRIVQLAMIKRFADGRPDVSIERKFNPGIPIPKEASDVHGITDDMVKDEPMFKDKAANIWAYMNGCDLGGYNILKFDIPLLVEEFLRSGVEPDFEGIEFFDAFVVYRELRPRTLAACYEDLTGKTMEDAHDALSDTSQTLEVLDVMEKLENFDELRKVDRIVDYAGKFAYNESGQIIYNFGKDKGKVVGSYDSFLDWMLRNDFTQDTKAWVRKLKQGLNT